MFGGTMKENNQRNCGFYYVKTTDGLIECKARGKFRHRDMKPLVGDDVEIVVEHGKGVICDIHERKVNLSDKLLMYTSIVVFAIKTPDTIMIY
ncbi:MAG: hypothetical protein ACLT69_15245 [Intestinibacter bartlettii]